MMVQQNLKPCYSGCLHLKILFLFLNVNKLVLVKDIKTEQHCLIHLQQRLWERLCNSHAWLQRSLLTKLTSIVLVQMS